MTIADRLNQLINKRGLLHREVASAIGITRQAFGRYLNGTVEPDREKIEMLAAYFDVSPSYLMFGEQDTDGDDGALNIPVLQGKDSGPICSFKVQKEWLSFLSMQADQNNLRVMVITDDNMVPTLKQGDVVMVDTSVDKIEKEGIYVLQAKGQRMVKRAQSRLDGTVLMIDDSIHYGHMILDKEQLKSIAILGKCVIGFKPQTL